MKRTLFTILVGSVLVLSLTPSAKADSFLSINVSATIVSCNNSTFGGVTACGFAGFTTALGSNSIGFTGTVNGVSFFAVNLLGNQPGGSVAFSTDTKTDMRNDSGASRPIRI